MLGTVINELPPFGKDITRLANNELTLFVWHKAPLEVYPPALAWDFYLSCIKICQIATNQINQ